MTVTPSMDYVRLSAGVENGDSRTSLRQRRCGAVSAVVCGKDGRSLAHSHAVFAKERMAGAGKHHAGAVIALEADGAFDRAGGVDDVAGLDAVVFHTGRVGPTIGFGEVVMTSLNSAKCACIVDAKHRCARQDTSASSLDLRA